MILIIWNINNEIILIMIMKVIMILMILMILMKYY